MIRTLFTLIFVAIQFVSFSNVTIRGMAYSYAGQTLAIYQIDDYISNHETLIKETEINSKGYFILSLEVPEIKKYIISVLR